MIIHIVAGGTIDFELSTKTADTIWVGVDRGTLALLELNIIPTVAIGDFDSVSREERERIKEKVEEVKIFPPHKDETDTELALHWALAQKPRKICIFGATGGRQDHFVANLQLLVQVIDKGYDGEIELVDGKNVISMKGPGTHNVTVDHSKKYISFFAVTEEVKQLNLSGFKYPLENKNLKLGSALCISNELNEEVGTFSFTSGILMMIRSSD